MPLFFFNHTSTNYVNVDDTGTEFPSLEAAYLDTCNAILEIAFEKLRTRDDPAHDAFEILGERGNVLLTIPFSEVLRPGEPNKRPIPLDSPAASSLRLMERHQVLKAALREEFKRTELEFRAVKANMARLDACSADWPK
jgi:hypothetical protein